MKSVTTKIYTTLLLALIAALASGNAWAGIKIYVRTEGNASGITPYLHAWNSSGDLTSWPGEAMTASTTTSDGVSWFVKEFDVDNLNIIISDYGNDQTSNIEGIQEDRYYVYKANNGEKYNLTNQYVIPDNATYVDGKKFVYFVNTSEWSTPHAHVYNGNGNITGIWPGEAMTKVQGSVNLWKWDKSTTETPASVIFNDGGSSQSSTLTFTNGGYYNTSDLITTITQLQLNSTNFPDANFRAALADALNVNEDDNIYPNNVKKLDVSGKGISNLTGIANFTNLEELYAQDNNLTSNSSNGATTCIDISSNTKLRILNLSNNNNNGSGKLVQVPGIAYCTQLEEYYFNDNDFWGSRQISGTNSVAANRISAENHKKLKRLELNNSEIQTSFTMPAFPALEYLDMSNNSSFNGFSAALNIPTLKTLKMSNANMKSTAVTINTIKNSVGLEYLDLSNNALDSINLFKNTALTYLDLSHNNLFNLNLANQHELVTMNMSYNPKLYCTVNYNNSTNFPSSVTNKGYIYIKGLSKLEELDMSYCSIYRAGAGTQFDGLTSLKKLNLSYNYATTNSNSLVSITTDNSTSCLQSLTALEELDLTGCSKLHLLQVDGLKLHTVKLEGTILDEQLVLTNNQLTNLNFPNETSLSTLTSLPSIDVSGNPFTLLTIPATPNSLLTVTANDCSAMTRVLAEHNGSKLRYVTAQNCPALTDITLNGVDIFFNYQVAAFDATNKSTLVTLDLSNDAMSTNYALDGFTALQTVDFDNNYMTGNNNNLKDFTAINCPALTTVNLDGNANMKTITLSNNGFSNSSYPLVTVDASASNVTLDFDNNNFTAVPNIQASQINVLKLNSNQLTDINIPDGCNVNYLYAQENNFGSGDYTLPQTSLVGLDLGNNGFTKFKAENNTSLKSLALGGNNDLTEIELHGNTALTQTSPDGVIESDNGLYIKGLSSLQTLNIENSSFNKLGQESSLEGCDGLTKLQARKNKFTTFTNSVYPLDVSTSGNYRYAETSESSLEHLVNLEYLDLAYNELCDSVHLYRNVNLKHLDVSHNNHITGVIDGTITADDVDAQNAMRTKKAKRLVKHGMKYGDKGELTDALYAQACADQKGRQVKFDIRYEDLNDTTGLYHLDLQKNVNLEWIDISYTNIHNTGAGPGVMNPGWMSADWVGDSEEALAATIKSNTETHRSHSAFHTFVYFAPCSKLKTIHMDHCNLQSLGISYFPELDTLTASYMYGDCYFMRDAKPNDLRYGMANTGPGRVRKYLSPKANSQGIEDAVNVVGPDGTENTYYDNNIKYYDISYSGFNELRFNYGINLEYINVSGNPLKFHVHPSSDYSYHNSLDVTYCPNIKTVLADNCSYLPTVRAYNRDALTTLDLTNDPQLKTVYVQDNAMLPSITGLSTLTGLETLFAYNNPQFRGIDVSNNTALKNLWVSRIGANSLDVSHNTGLLKLRAYDNLLEALNVGANTALTWLDVARNKIPSLDLSANAALQYFNCSNSEETLVDQSLAANSHNGGEADEVKPVTGSHSASHTGNSLSDLVFNTDAPIADVRANSNDLHYINGSFGNLTHIEFAHNHINGINLAAAAANNPTIVDEDNGRAITAECAKFIKHGTAEEVTVYYFQLANIRGQQLTGKTSTDSKNATRNLGEDGFELGKIAQWDGTNSAHFVPTTAGIMPRGITVDPSNMADYLGADVEGDIVVLKEDAQHPGEGRATYSYYNGVGNSTSTFYLDWEANAVHPTAINVIEVGDGLSIAGSYGGLTINGADGTVVGVYDMSGRQVASETISGGKATITGLTSGIYVVNGQKVVVK